MGARFPADFHLLLASQSPRRHSLLRDLGVPFTVVSSHADEVLHGGTAAELAERNALEKVVGAVLPSRVEPGAFVLGTDTLVTVDGQIMGKPSSASEAADMVGALSGRTHQVASGVALLRTTAGASVMVPLHTAAGATASGGCAVTGCAVTDVTFERLTEGEIAAYVETGEWKGKAGGYAIQGLAGLFVSGISGEYSNVVGLPLCLLARLFRSRGFDLLAGRWL